MPDGGFSYFKGQGFSAFARTAAAIVGLLLSASAPEDEEINAKAIDRGLQVPTSSSSPGGSSTSAPRSRHSTTTTASTTRRLGVMWTAGGDYWRSWFPAVRDELLGRARAGGGSLERPVPRHRLRHHAMSLIVLQLPNNYLAHLCRSEVAAPHMTRCRVAFCGGCGYRFSALLAPPPRAAAPTSRSPSRSTVTGRIDRSLAVQPGREEAAGRGDGGADGVESSATTTTGKRLARLKLKGSANAVAVQSGRERRWQRGWVLSRRYKRRATVGRGDERKSNVTHSAATKGSSGTSRSARTARDWPCPTSTTTCGSGM